jgi:hypothetical protein
MISIAVKLLNAASASSKQIEGEPVMSAGVKKCPNPTRRIFENDHIPGPV